MKEIIRLARLPFILSFTMLIISACLVKDTPPSTEPRQRLNVLLIISDDQALDTIHAYGNEQISTPNLDKLVNDGLSFTHVFNQGSWSAAVCSPSRRMINTGRHLFHTGMDWRRDQQHEYPVLGESFKDAGYDTFQTGKWHLPMEVWERSFSHGAAVFKGGMSPLEEGGQWQTMFANYQPEHDTGTRFIDYRAYKHTSEEIADAAVGFIDSRTAQDKPFLMYVAFLAPHDPRQAPASNLAEYPVDEIKLPDNFLPSHPFDQGDYYIRDEELANFPRSPEEVRKNIADYYAMITHMDTQIGRILKVLKKSGQAENTLIVFTSDHGLAVGRHGLMGKQNQYEHSIRVPFIMAGPNIPGQAVAPGMFYLNSIFPTVADLAGVPIAATVQAPSIVPLIKGEKNTMYDSIYGSYRYFQRMLRTSDHKLIYYPMIHRTQLFNLRDDPDELNDLSNDPAQAKRIAEMMSELEGWKEMVGDPLKNDDPEGSFEGLLIWPGVQ